MRYSSPALRSLGSLSYLTLGNHGSSPDGNGKNNQTGGGNDCTPGTVGGSTQNGGLPGGSTCPA